MTIRAITRSCVLAALLVSGSLPSCAEDKSAKAEADAPVWNAVAHQAKAAGVREACLQRVHNMTQFLMAGGQANGIIYYDQQKPADHLFSAVIGQQGQAGAHLGLMSMTQAGDCSAGYEIVKVWANTCPQVVQSVYPGAQPKAELAGGTTVLELGQDEHLYVMAAPGNGCVTIHKAMVFQPVQ